MTTIRSVQAAIAAGLLLLTGACAQQAGAEDGQPGAGTLQPDEVVLRVQWTGGFVTPTMLASRLPLVSVYADGRVISEGAQIMIYPAPALPSIQVRQISEADVAKLVEMAKAAGVGDKADYGQPPVADAPTTKFTVRTADGEVHSEVYALAEGQSDDQSLTAAQHAARAKMRDLLDALTDLSQTLGEGKVGESKMYEPESLAVFANAYVVPEDPAGVQPKMDWPGPALPGVEIQKDLDLWCLDVTGSHTATVLAAAAKANMATPWASEGKEWTVTFRPVLPDETGCSHLNNGN